MILQLHNANLVKFVSFESKEAIHSANDVTRMFEAQDYSFDDDKALS